MTSTSERRRGFPLSNISGRAGLTLMRILSCFLLAFGFLLLLQTPATAWPTKYTSCSSCHSGAYASAAIMTALNGSQGTSITVATSSTFEVDWRFTNLANSSNTTVGAEIAVPTGWTVTSGTANNPQGFTSTGSPAITWSSQWDAADGVGWDTAHSYSTASEYPSSPVGYTINYNQTNWGDTASNAKVGAYDNGSSSTPGDLDRTANVMGADARISVPVGTLAGTYTIMVVGVGHTNQTNSKAHIEQAITVNVTPTVTSASPNSMPQGSGPTTVTINGGGFTNTGLSVSFSGTGVTTGSPTYVSATQITVPVTVAAGATIGLRDVTVTCSGQSGTGTGIFSVTAGKLDQTITVTTPAPSSAPYNSQFTVAATASSGLTVSYSSGTPAVCTNSGATFTMVNGTGTCTVRYDQAGNATYNAAPQVTNSVTATKIAQATVTVSAPASASYGQTGLSATASGGSGTGAYSYSAGSSTACTVNSSTGTLTITSGTGTCSITATRAADTNYNVSAASAPANVTITKATQATVTVSAPANAYYGQTGLSATASGGSGTGAYSYDAGSSTACSVNSSTGALTITSGTGTCSITATRAADANYNVSAASTPATVTITKATPTVTAWPTASAITYGQTLASSTLSGGSASTTGTFAFTTPATAPNAGTASQGVTFTPTDTTNYNTATGSVSVTVAKADPSVTAWPTASGITYGQTLASSTLSGGSSTPAGTFAFTAPATAPDAGTASQGVTFTPADTTNYNAATGSVSVTVNKADQAITFGALATRTYGDPSFTLSASGGASGNAVTFASSNAAVATVSGTTVTIVGAGITTITASQAGNANYNAASDVYQSLTVDKANQTITFAALPAKNVGDADFAPGGTASSTLTVTYASSNTAVATIVAGQIHIVGPGTTDITASQAGDANFNAAADVVQPLTVTASSAPHLNMTINGKGSVNSNPAGIACDHTGGQCSSDFTAGPVVLTAASSWNYDFAGWLGGDLCNGTTTNPCTVNVSSTMDMTATFTARQLVRMQDGSYKASIQEAYGAAAEGDTLKLRDQNFTENLDFNSTSPVLANVNLDGGYNADYTAVTGSTTITGSLTLTSGGITVSNIIIQ